ncbi:MAG: ABC transporter permease [Bacteroidetes bacterium]|nr:ABC transporter permease [Bacteroidota bacterium]
MATAKSFFSFIGRKTLNFFSEFGRIFILAKNILKYCPRVFRDKKLIIQQMAIIGADSLPLVVLIGVFTGAIAALQATTLFDKFNLMGIATPFLGGSISTVMFQELTPVFTALVIAGRVGGSMAAQIGAMQITEQIDALEIMAIDRNRYLGMPRVVATFIMIPLLAIFSSVVALLGAYFIVVTKFNIQPSIYIDSIQNYFKLYELFVCLAKTAAFGVVTSLIGVYVGFNTKDGAEGVGNSTVKSFTLSAAAILILDAIIGLFI